MTTKQEISEIIDQFKYLPNSPINNLDNSEIINIVNQFHSVLHDLSVGMVQAAASAYLASGRFFPSPGDVRQKAVDIALIAMDVPTPAEAWGIVNTGEINKRHLCREGERLFFETNGLTGNKYWASVASYSKHFDECPNCFMGKSREWHPAVRNAFDAMGGDRAVFTDNPAADRARFTQGYRDYVERKVLQLSMPASVRGYIEEQRESLTLGKIKELSESMERPALYHPHTGERLE